MEKKIRSSDIETNIMERKSIFQKWGARHTFITLSFFLMIMNQCWRINLSVAIVAMVNHGK